MFNPTKEQIVANALVSEGKSLLIEAGAGAAKSTSLRYFAQENPDKNFLVLCFNKANAVESNEHPDKPSNIYYSTVHAIAYGKVVDKLMRNKLSNYLDYKDIDVNKLIQLGLTTSAKDIKDEKEILIKLRAAIQNCITWYCRSDSRNLENFAQKLYYNQFGYDSTIVNSEEDIALKEDLVLTLDQMAALAKFTSNYWQLLIDSSSEAKITHDIYLKLFDLREFSITDFFDFNSKETVPIHVLCLDEAQDSNGVTISIFKRSRINQKIVVGDEMQQLYAWRGAGDAMQQFKHFSIAYLTQSFRFPQHIADMANIVLSNAGSDMQITGSGAKEIIETKAHLCRTNSALLSKVWQAASQQKKVYTSADLKELFSKLYHLSAVHFDQIPKYPNKSLKDIKTKAQSEEATKICPEIGNLVKIGATIASAGGTLHNGIKLLNEWLVPSQEHAEVIVSTIHKSKGLEWDEVTIDDDFIPLKEEDNLGECLSNMWADNVKTSMLYVAITRAKVAVNLPWYLEESFKEGELT